MDRPQPVHALSDADLVRLRRDRVGFAFQTFGLLPILTAAENVEVTLRLGGVPVAHRRPDPRGGTVPRC